MINSTNGSFVLAKVFKSTVAIFLPLRKRGKKIFIKSNYEYRDRVRSRT